MRRSSIFFIETVVALSSEVFGHLTLPEDNPRSRYRQDAARFSEPWPVSSPLTRPMAHGGLPSDLSVHSPIAANRTFLGESRWVDALYFIPYELDFNASPVCAICRRFWWAGYVASALYVGGLWLGQSLMEKRAAMDLRRPLWTWNLFLACFSVIGTLRTAPHLFLMLRQYGFDHTLCRAAVNSFGNGPVGFWVALFIFSKYFELIDTVFLVLRKRKIVFLHWFHHASVLLYCWHSYVFEMPTGIYFVVMNYSVHALMYFYYFLALVCTRPPPWALLVTVLQLLQMAVGIIVTVVNVHIAWFKTVPHCDCYLPNLAAALCMYAAYFALFADFLFKRYCRKRKGKASKATSLTNGKKHE